MLVILSLQAALEERQRLKRLCFAFSLCFSVLQVCFPAVWMRRHAATYEFMLWAKCHYAPACSQMNLRHVPRQPFWSNVIGADY